MARIAADRNPWLRDCRSRLAMLMVVIVVSLAGGSIHPVVAQQSTPSHRMLGSGLPSFGGSASQMELLRRLQMLSGAAQTRGQDLLNSKQADPQTLDSLQRAMQQLQGMNHQPLEGNLPNLPEPQGPVSNGPSASGSGRGGPHQDGPRGDEQRGDEQRGDGQSGVGNDGEIDGTQRRPGNRSPDDQRDENVDRSALRRLAEKMGLSLGQPRRPSTGADRNRQGGLPEDREPQLRESRSGSVGTSSESRSPGSSPFPPGRSEELNAGQPGSLAEEPNAPNRLSGTRAQPNNPGGSLSEQPDRRNAGTGETGRNGAGSRVPGSPAADGTGNANPLQNEAGRSNQGSSRSETPPEDAPKSSMRSLMDWLAGRSSSKSGEGQASPGSSANSPDGTSVASSEPGRPAGTSQGNSLDGTGNAAVTGAPSTELTEDNDDFTRAAESESAEDRLTAQRNERLDDLRDSSKSLRQKLIDIAKLARSESGQTPSSTEESTSEPSDGLQAVFTDMLAEATKELTEHVDDLVTRERVARSERGRWRAEGRNDRGGPFGRIGRIGDQATEWLADTVEPETRAVTESDAGLSGSGLPESISPFAVFLILLTGGGIILWLLQRTVDAGSMKDGNAVHSTAPATLKNRQDIVQAFHDLAARCPISIADWWTHDRAATALAVTRPERTDDVRRLAQLYEQARYLPDESSLSEEQLAAAKAAWLRCRKS